jgi:hypothetical protein
MSARVTAADASKDVRSLDRALPRRLYLVVKPVGRPHWEFPAAFREKGESMIKTAVRELYDSVGKSLYVYPTSALPIAHHVPPVERAAEGRVFFYRGQLLAGAVQ